MPERLGRVLSPKVKERKQTDMLARQIMSAMPLRNVDLVLVGCALFLVGFGMLMIYSSTRLDVPGNPTYYVMRQIGSLVIGLILMAVFMLFDYRRLKVATPFIYGLVIFFLILVFLTKEAFGSQRWITLGPLTIQPSEFAKLTVILLLANFFSENRQEPDTMRSFAVPVLWTAPIMLLIFLQPDLGTTLVVTAILLGLLFLAGARLRYWMALTVGGAAVFAMGFVFHIFQQYQIDRFLAFLKPGLNPKDIGYQLVQSKIAVGSGQFLGKGLTRGTQIGGGFVPVHSTDFIFSVIGEELGFVGALILIAAFCFLLWRTLRVANNARDYYGSLLAMGIFTMLAFQLVVNIGMTIGIMPITGIPLPFISSGGSSLMVNLVAIGLLENIYMRRFAQF